MNLSRTLKLAGITAVGILFNSCAQIENAVVEKAMSMAADDQIMLVRKEPESFGFVRLASQSRTYPDLGTFVSKRGLPDFLAEANNRNQQYFILYYLKNRQAFACRTRSPSSRTIEFSGPYPITDKEFLLLDGFRRDPSRVPTKR
jgi:hypothetical protein